MDFKKGVVNEVLSSRQYFQQGSTEIFSSLIQFSGFINGSEVRKSVPVKFAEDTILVRVNSDKVGSI